MPNEPNFYFVGKAAEILKVNPRDISDLLYHRKLDCDKCPLIGTRRIIPKEYMPEVEKALIEYGSITPKGK